MPFIPHTSEDVKHMLDAIAVDRLDALFDEIPKQLPRANLKAFPEGLSEGDLMRLMSERASALPLGSCFIGAGAYEHHIPAAVWEIAKRGEFYTAYTPYQGEVSQGSLQVIYEYQTMMSSLMGLDVSNASQYDGSSALAEAVLMAVRVKRGRAKRVVVPVTLHPLYRKVLRTLLVRQGIIIEEVPFCPETGCLLTSTLEAIDEKELAAVVIPQPNFFGILETVDTLTDIAHAKGALAIAVVNPIAMALLKEPGAWGEKGVDIACGEGQPLGVPLSFGGPYFGFLTCKQSLIRHLPGRLVGKTCDAKGREGFTLTLQAREQHIRRSKAMSNICTNQGLVVTAATIYMSLLGAKGLSSVAMKSHQQASDLLQRLLPLEGVKLCFNGPMFCEFTVSLPCSVEDVLSGLARKGIQGGYSLKQDYPALGDSLLICATDTKTVEDLVQYQKVLKEILERLSC